MAWTILIFLTDVFSQQKFANRKTGCRFPNTQPCSSWALAPGERTAVYTVHMFCKQIKLPCQCKQNERKKEHLLKISILKGCSPKCMFVSFLSLSNRSLLLSHFIYTPPAHPPVGHHVRYHYSWGRIQSFFSSKAPDCPISPVIFFFLFLFRSLTSHGGLCIGRPREADDSSLSLKWERESESKVEKEWESQQCRHQTRQSHHKGHLGKNFWSVPHSTSLCPL